MWTDTRRIYEGSRRVREDTQEYTQYGGFADGFTDVYNGFSNAGSQRIRASTFARVRASSRRICRYQVRGWIHNGYTTDSRIDERTHTGIWVHKG